MMKKYYLRYNELNGINYIYLLRFYMIAEYNDKTKRYDIIKYRTNSMLLERLNGMPYKRISMSTLKRILKDTSYRQYLEIDTNKKTIRILSDITNTTKFVVLSEDEVNLIQ